MFRVPETLSKIVGMWLHGAALGSMATPLFTPLFAPRCPHSNHIISWWTPEYLRHFLPHELMTHPVTEVTFSALCAHPHKQNFNTLFHLILTWWPSYLDCQFWIAFISVSMALRVNTQVFSEQMNVFGGWMAFRKKIPLPS